MSKRKSTARELEITPDVYNLIANKTMSQAINMVTTNLPDDLLGSKRIKAQSVPMIMRFAKARVQPEIIDHLITAGVAAPVLAGKLIEVEGNTIGLYVLMALGIVEYSDEFKIAIGHLKAYEETN